MIGFANDGIAGVPGRAARGGHDARTARCWSGGGLDPGYPLPGKIRQARFALPAGTDWKGLLLKAELEVKGVRYPVRWACHQALEADGSLKLRRRRDWDSHAFVR